MEARLQDTPSPLRWTAVGEGHQRASPRYHPRVEAELCLRLLSKTTPAILRLMHILFATKTISSVGRSLRKMVGYSQVTGR